MERNEGETDYYLTQIFKLAMNICTQLAKWQILNAFMEMMTLMIQSTLLLIVQDGKKKGKNRKKKLTVKIYQSDI